jgi:hypothetical protein
MIEHFESSTKIVRTRMTEFAEDLRHYCRNPKCRMKLKAPVANVREAFCTRGCFNSFYLHRCLVCEGSLERKNETQKVCKKAKCRRVWQAQSGGFGRYLTSGPSAAGEDLKTPIKSGFKSALGSDRRWRIVAGELAPPEFRGATVPDGPNCQWAGGSFEHLERRNRAVVEAHFDRLDAAAVADDFRVIDDGNIPPCPVRTAESEDAGDA